MKRRRTLLILGCLTAMLLAGFVGLRLTRSRANITEENFNAIKPGMAEPEVVAILGAPAGVYSYRGESGVYVTPSDRPSSICAEIGKDLINREGGKEWVGENISIYVRFDEIGRVSERLKGIVIPSESFLAKLRRWLGM